MKKRLLLVIAMLIVVIAVMLFIGTGFIKRTDVYLADYSVSEDGTNMTMNIGIESPMGYPRDCTVKQDGDKNYVAFYSAFGGLNSSIGAKYNFEIKLNPSCTEIYFYHGNGEYSLVLQKNEITNRWEKSR